MSNTNSKKRKGQGGDDSSGMIGIAFRFVNSLSQNHSHKQQAAAGIYKQIARIVQTAKRLQAEAIVKSAQVFAETLGAKLAKVVNHATTGFTNTVRPPNPANAARAGITLKT